MLPSTNQYGAVARPASSWVVADRTATPLASVQAHRRLTVAIIAIVTLIGLVAAMLYGRDYVAEVTIRVSPVVPASLAGEESRFSSNADYRDFVQEQVFEINNYATVSGALDLLGPKRWLWQLPGETDRHSAERLMAALKVEPVAYSYLVRIELGGGSPQGLDEIVNSVAKSYLSRTAKRELDGADVGFQLLTSRQTELQKNIADDQQQYSGLIQELGVSSVSGELVNPYDKMLADTNAALAHARRNVLQAQAHLDAVKSHRERIKDADVEAKAQAVAATSTDTTSARQQLIQQREQALVELSGLGPNHPGRQALEAQIATTNKELANVDQAALNRARSMLSDSEEATTSVDISEAESNLDQMESSEKGLEKELQSVKATASTFGAKYSQAVNLHERLERRRKDLQDLQERMSLLRLKTQAPGVVALESAAMVPDAPQKSRRRLIFALFALTALLLGVAVPTAIDLTDSRLKTADEFERILGFPPLGVALGSNAAGQEAMRRIALGIMREWRTSGIRNYVLTSVRQGGNAYLALALANELSDLGVRTLAIEASLTRSNGHHRKPSSPAGAVSVSTRETKRLVPRIANTVALDGIAQSMPQTVGDGILQRAQKNGVARPFGYIRESVDRALDNHDIVLLAAPPLLSSADTAAIIQMPAGAILVARAGYDNASEVAAAVRELAKCAPPVVGAIICGNGHLNGAGEYPFDLELETADSSATSMSYGLVSK
jgi:succinoglycan biosynthesis transport protein ExoP